MNLDSEGHVLKQQFCNRTRDGLYGAAQWKKDDIESSLTFFRSKYKFDWNEYNVSAQNDPTASSCTGRHL